MSKEKAEALRECINISKNRIEAETKRLKSLELEYNKATRGKISGY